VGDQFERLIRKQNRRGIFDGFNVDGFQYENASGETGWQITAWPGRDPINCYWVQDKKFFGVKIQIFPGFLNEIQLQKMDEILAITEAERNAVLKAIVEWEKPLEV
jgi:hypothetical protein